MILFIDPISENIQLSILDGGEVRQTSTIPRGRDYDEFPDMLIDIYDRHSIESIWCIVGPGAFTRMRIISLGLNALKLIHTFELKSCHFFDIIDTPSPILKANDREYIIRDGDSTRLMAKEEIPHGTYTGYGDKNDFTGERKFVEYVCDPLFVSKVFAGIQAVDRVTPIYLKDPHITWSKKNT